MEKEDLLRLYAWDGRVQRAKEALSGQKPCAVALSGLVGSAQAVVCQVLSQDFSGNQLFILRDREQAAYFCNDLEKLSGEEPGHGQGKKTLFFPASYRRPYDSESVDNANVLSRTEVLERLQHCKQGLRIVTYPEALAEKVIANKQLAANTVNIHVGEKITQDFLTEFLERYRFRLVDFVAEPGEFALRGGILDVFSFSADLPFRIEFDDESVHSIRSFEVGNQLSVERLQQVSLIPDIQQCVSVQQRVDVFSYFEEDACLWVEDAAWCLQSLGSAMEKAEDAYGKLDKTVPRARPDELYCSPAEIEEAMRRHKLVEIGSGIRFSGGNRVEFTTEPQPVFNKKFELLADYILDGTDHGFTFLILSENAKQFQRLDRVFFELSKP
ncbi:MAG: hypothetical protein K2I87_02110, partial [Bacteroidales bacterium]|nr:hypothetical protein [Bacteroidales bacterium]